MIGFMRVLGTVRWVAVGLCNWLRARATLVLGTGVLFGALVAVYVLPLVLVPDEDLDAEKRLKAENDFRGVLIQVLGGSIVLAGTARTLHINREGQITERFTRAIDQLGQSDDHKLDVRLGGIYALERIARDSKSDRGPIIEVMTAFLREHARWIPDSQEATSDTSGSNPVPLRTRADFQAVVTVLGRNNWAQRYSFDLRKVDLSQANLFGANLEGALLSNANLEGAYLLKANLKGAYLRDANLEGVILTDANLEGAILTDVNLKGAYLLRANLKGANLESAIFSDANLEGAYLFYANLNDASLEGVDLSDTNLEGANLESLRPPRGFPTP